MKLKSKGRNKKQVTLKTEGDKRRDTIICIEDQKLLSIQTSMDMNDTAKAKDA